MTALATSFARAREGVHPVCALQGGFPLAASVRLYVGSLVAVNGAGHVVPAHADSTLFVIGVAEEEVDNSGGLAGALSISAIRRGAFLFANSGTTGAVTDADVGRACFAVDDNTVSRLSLDGARPPAGIVRRVDASGLVSVEVGLASRNAIEGVTDYLYPAGADLSTTGQYLFVKLSGSSEIVLASAAGESALGVLQNAPASGAVAIVRRRGPSRVIAGASIADGALLAVQVTTGRAKGAVACTVAGGAGDPANDGLVGSFCMGMALSDGTDGAAMTIDVHPMGAIPTTAA